MRQKFWRTMLGLILLAGIYLFLPASEIAIARTWLETVLSRFR